MARRGEQAATRAWLTVFPALGFFGATASDCLRLRLPGPVSALKLFLGTESSEFLNLRGVVFLKQGAPLTLDPEGLRVEASSFKGKSAPDQLPPLLRMGGHHSLREERPWWQVRFTQPLLADEVRIYNRGDRWGSRAATLCVEVVDAAGSAHSIYRGREEASVTAVKDAFASLGLALSDPASGAGAVAFAEYRTRLLAGVAGLLRAKADAVPDAAWRVVIQLVDFWSRRVPSDDELTLVAGYLMAQREQHHATSLRAFMAILDSRRTLDRLGAALMELARVRGADPLLVTRHGLSAVGKLIGNTGDVLDHLHEVLDVLEASGGSPMLAYGTLLGAVRAGTFIPHDDDVDVLFMASSRDRETVKAEMARLRQRFLRAGFTRVDHVRGSLNLHVFHPETGAMVDVFPCWEVDGEVKLHMESMKVRGIAPEIFRPRSAVRLHGRLYPAPGCPEQFLEERYGKAWADPDPYFEWPWPLRDTAGS